MYELHLVQLGTVDRTVTDFLTVALNDSLELPCRVLSASIDIAPAFDPGRRQYNSMDVLLELTRLRAANNAKILGLIDVDLFVPILTFVFGQAQLGNRAALMSTHRLHQSYYGLPEDDSLFLQRCEKEAVHELGHTFGLVHCRDFECVMHFSNSIEQVDLKANFFCTACEEVFRSAAMAVSSAR